MGRVKNNVMETIRVLKFTEERWFCPYTLGSHYRGKAERKLVEVSFIQFLDKTGWRVAVWGADDYGMEKDFPPENYQEAQNLFFLVIQQELIRKDFLLKNGFGFA